MYSSPVDLAIMLKANTDLFEFVYGDVLEDGEGVALFMTAPELRYKLSFETLVHLTLEKKGIELLYGMDLEDKSHASIPWQKLVTNKDNLLKFLRSKKEPDLFLTAPAGVHILGQRFEEMGFVDLPEHPQLVSNALLGRQNFLYHRATVKSVTSDRGFSIGRAQRDLVYEPRYDLPEGIRETVAWYRENGYL